MDNVGSVILEISEGKEDDVSWDYPDLLSELRVTNAEGMSCELRAGIDERPTGRE